MLTNRKTGQTNRMDVYLFGAGASAAEGAPATDEFLATAWQLTDSAADARVAAVWQFLTDVFGGPVSSPASFDYLPPLDQIFSLIDWSLHVDQGLGARYDPARLRQVRRDLEYLVCVALDAALKSREHRAAGPHARFVRRLLEQGRAGGFVLLSLNYDTLLDDALSDAGSAPDYGFRDLDLRKRQGPLLAKLHGSLNWALCKACDHVEVAHGKVAHRLPHLEGLACSRCGADRLHGMIISPTWLKSYHTPQLRHVWDLALESIQRAERLVFIGYSMPPADIAIFQLIRRGLLTNRSRGRLRVEVINHHHSEEGPFERALREQAVIRHFNQLFGPGVLFDFSGFQGQT